MWQQRHCVSEQQKCCTERRCHIPAPNAHTHTCMLAKQLQQPLEASVRIDATN